MLGLSLAVRTLGESSSADLLVNPGMVETAAGVRYLFFLDKNSDLAYTKSSNHGYSWGTPVVIHGGAYLQATVWFDQWTPGDSGTKIHIWGLEAGADNVNYFSLDTADDTLGNSGTAIIVFDGATFSTGDIDLAGSKSRGGNLYVAFDGDSGDETGFYRSVDSGANWTSRANPNEAASTDYYMLFPGNEADTQDMWLVFWDRSANELSLKTYDDSADSWAETSIQTSMSDIAVGTCQSQFAGCINPINNHLLLAAWSNRASATGDLLTWDINGSGSITAKANILTDAAKAHTVALTYLTGGRIVATYLGNEAASETLATALGVYQKFSDDGMATWTSELTVSNTWLGSRNGLVQCPISPTRRHPYTAFLELETLGAGDDALFVAYQPTSVRSISAIGV